MSDSPLQESQQFLGRSLASQKQAPQPAAEFIITLIQYFAHTKGDPEQAFAFLQTHEPQLNEELFEILPAAFEQLTASQPSETQQSIASIFVLLGNRIQEYPRGDRPLNLEIAIAAYQLALQIHTCEAFPQDWAMTQNNLGNAYSRRLKGDRAENLELAIVSYQLALQVRTREAFPQDWAMTQNNLGAAYRKRIKGERVENLELAIVSYQLALQVRTREVFPQDWAITQNNLGLAYSDRIKGDRAENLELAIKAYKLALQIRTRNSFPLDWAMTQNNLGNAYSNRIKSDRAENLELAIKAYKLALQVYTREAFPQDWGTTQNNLGNAYYERIRGDRAKNLKLAIEAYQLTLPIITRQKFPQQWAMTQGNLAGALMERAKLTGNADDLNWAIQLLQEALPLSVSGSPEFINDQYKLGNALSLRYEHSQQTDDLQQAMHAYQTALNYLSPEHYNREWMWKSLPETKAVLGIRLVREGRWQEGLQLLLVSLNQLSHSNESLIHADTLFQTGKAYEYLTDWDNARLYYRDALRLYEHLEEVPGIARSRAALGGVLVSQGLLERGLAELVAAQKLYHQLQQPDRATELEPLCEAARRALERQVSEALP